MIDSLLDNIENSVEVKGVKPNTNSIDDVIKISHRSFETFPAFCVMHGFSIIFVDIDLFAKSFDSVWDLARGFLTTFRLPIESLLNVVEQIILKLCKMLEAFVLIFGYHLSQQCTD